MKKALFSLIVTGLMLGYVQAQAAEPGIQLGFPRNALIPEAKVGLRAPTTVLVVHIRKSDPTLAEIRKNRKVLRKAWGVPVYTEQMPGGGTNYVSVSETR